jgi:outer membrane cobalamin receptor
MAQLSFEHDTVHIKEVTISGIKTRSDQVGYKSTEIDSSVIKNYSHQTVADILEHNSGIFIKSYGMGGVATPSFRGTGAGHTQLLWNGLDISNPMLGQSDLSLIPGGLIDEIHIFYGGASMSLVSGGIGGMINLETHPVWKKRTSITLSPGVASFGRYTGVVKIIAGNSHFQTITKAYLNSSENDFRYLNTVSGSEPVWETRNNSQVRQKGVIQELYYRKDNNVASARIWYQSADRNLPSSMLVSQLNSKENQDDESLRTMLNYDFVRSNNTYFVSGAYMFSRLDYTNSLAAIDSRNLSQNFNFKTGMESKIGDKTKLKVVLDEEIIKIKTNNYQQDNRRNTTSITVSAERQNGKRFGSSILVREILDNNIFLIPDFSAGLQFRIAYGKEYFLKANISRNSKIPTMNELYWLPGGNPDLKNEYAYMFEGTYEMSQRVVSDINIKFDLSAYRNNIHDLIQWHPGEYSYWTAENIKNVTTSGLESSLKIDYKRNNLTVSLNSGYTLTRAKNEESDLNNSKSEGKQLIYIPEKLANCSMLIRYRNIYSNWLYNFTGKRYTTVDNSRYLPAYSLNSIKTGIAMNFKKNTLDINFCIDNLFNVSYEAIAFYPMPGRSYMVNIQFQINN